MVLSVAAVAAVAVATARSAAATAALRLGRNLEQSLLSLGR